MFRVLKENLIYAMAETNEPALRVPDKSTIVFETCDCFENQIRATDTPFQALDWNRINPATGPVYIEGAEPGDMLVVKIERIQLAERGVMVTGPGMGVIGEELKENVIRLLPIQDGKVLFSDLLQIPLNPMIGVIGTAPKCEPISCGTPGRHGGNMDCKVIGQGATLYLPVNVPGALLAMGDLHAAMGDGEVCVCGVEIAGEVTVSVSIVKDSTRMLPMVKTQQSVYTIASAKLLDDAASLATANMVHFLSTEGNLSKDEAIAFLSIAGNLQICQVVDPLKTARFEVSLDYIRKLGIEI